MRRSARLLVPLLVGLALLTTAGYVVLTQTTLEWFNADLALRSQLAGASARQSLRRPQEFAASGAGRALVDATAQPLGPVLPFVRFLCAIAIRISKNENSRIR
jgi:hypothetical protein